MTLNRVIKIKNGSYLMPYRIYNCDKCGREIEEAWPRDNDTPGLDYCFDCSFKMGRIDWKTWIDAGTGFNSSMFKAAIHPELGEIEIAMIRSKFSWERKDKDYRHSVEYKKWRDLVFQRDSYTCQHCNHVGGELNAHHIKSFNKFKKLRFEISNGITLCVKCHRKTHTKKKAV